MSYFDRRMNETGRTPAKGSWLDERPDPPAQADQTGDAPQAPPLKLIKGSKLPLAFLLASSAGTAEDRQTEKD